MTMLVWLYPPVWRRLVSKLPMLVTALTLSLSLKTMMLQELKEWSVLRIFSKKSTSGSKIDFRRAQKFVKWRHCLNEIEKKVHDREHNLVIQGIYIDSHKIGQFELDNPPSSKQFLGPRERSCGQKRGKASKLIEPHPPKYFCIFLWYTTWIPF